MIAILEPFTALPGSLLTRDNSERFWLSGAAGGCCP